MNRSVSTDTDQDMTAAMRLLRRFCVFLIPLVLLFALGEVILWGTGENWPVSQVVRVQQAAGAPTLYMRNLMSQQFGIYKLECMRQRNAQIVAIGSSRVMQFRDVMFAPMDSSFFNGGGMIQGVYDIDALADLVQLSHIPKPTCVIIGVDPWWLSESHSQQATELYDTDDAYSFAAHVQAIRMCFDRKYSGDILDAFRSQRASGFSMSTIGVAATVERSGFRNDGSMQYSMELREQFASGVGFIDYEDPPILGRILQRTRQFAAPTKFDPQLASILQRAVEKLVNSGVEVWAYTPPFTNESMEAVLKDNELREWWNEYQSDLFPRLLKAGANVLTLSEFASHRMPDEYMMDGFHPGEVYSGHIVLAMIEKAPADSRLKQIDAAALRDRIDAADCPLQFQSEILADD